MNYLDPINKLLIFIGWWLNYPPFFKGNLEKSFKYDLVNFFISMLFCFYTQFVLYMNFQTLNL